MITATAVELWLIRAVLGLGLLAGLLNTMAAWATTEKPTEGNMVGGKRVALVIGNATYSTGPLRNSANDASDIAKTLRELGFRVGEHLNVGQSQMEDAVRSFAEDLRGASVGLFYFSGHGVQVAGRNYLIPVGAHIEAEDEVRYKSLDAGFVLDKMEHAGSKVNLIILDACRDNPYARSFRSSSSSGLAGMEAPAGSLVAYSTAPGKVAGDGTGHNGTYTKHLLTAMHEPNLPAEMMFKRVREAVMEETQNKQVPWESSALIGNDFYFAAKDVIKEKSPVASVDSGVEADNLTLRSLEIVTVPTGATVWIDGRKVGQTPLIVEHKIGKAQVRVELAGYQEREENLWIKEESDQQLVRLLLSEIVANDRTEEPSAPAISATEQALGPEIVSNPEDNLPLRTTTTAERYQNNYVPPRRKDVDIFRLDTYPTPRVNIYEVPQRRNVDSFRSEIYENSYSRSRNYRVRPRRDMNSFRLGIDEDPYPRRRRHENRRQRDMNSFRHETNRDFYQKRERYENRRQRDMGSSRHERREDFRSRQKHWSQRRNRH